MNLMTLKRTAALLLLLTFSSVGTADTTKTDRWTEDAVLHDGRVVVVERELHETMDFRIADPFFGLAGLLSAGHRRR
jgi:hypothetical protein